MFLTYSIIRAIMERERKKAVEIVNLASYDVVLNVTALDQAKVEQVQKLIKANLLSGRGSPFMGWEASSSYRIYYDRKDDPRYVAKQKWSDSGMVSLTVRLPRDVASNDYWKTSSLSCNSLLNELYLAERVREIINGEEAQRIAVKCGCISLRFVEPLLGVIDRKKQVKYVVYEYVKGRGQREATHGDSSIKSELAEKLEHLFRARGIEPYDLCSRQFILDDTENGAVAYLIDIEGYFLMKQRANVNS